MEWELFEQLVYGIFIMLPAAIFVGIILVHAIIELATGGGWPLLLITAVIFIIARAASRGGR